MNKLSLLVATVLVACGTSAHAEQAAPNPFARPQANSPAAGAPTPGTSGAPGATGGQPPLAPQAAQGTTPLPAGVPPVLPGFSPGPGMPPTPVNSAPLPPGVMPLPATTPGVTTTEEEVTAQRVGKVNGVLVYRGQNTYMFESSRTRKIVRKLVPSTTPIMPTLPPTNTAGQPATKAPNLPSMVGRPNPN